MKIPEMAWITPINYTLSYSCVYCIYFIIHNVYIFCLLIHITVEKEFAASVTGSVGFLREGTL